MKKYRELESFVFLLNVSFLYGEQDESEEKKTEITGKNDESIKKFTSWAKKL